MRAGRRAAALLAAMIAVAACAGPEPTPSITASPVAPATDPGGPTPSSSARSPTQAPSEPAVAPIDPSLLDVLPTMVADLPIQPAPDAVADAAGDPAIIHSVEALAAALVVDPATDEFAYATVMRFFDGVMTEAFYRDWRDSYDEGACVQAGGVSGHAEAEIGGRQTFIGSCAGGVRTYHTWLENEGVLVSVSSVGEQRLGEQLVEGLRD